MTEGVEGTTNSTGDSTSGNGVISQSIEQIKEQNDGTHQAEKQKTLNEPNATLYVSNLDWSIKRPLLKRALLSLFTRHGKVLEVIALRREGLRGQAFIIFEDVTSATNALNEERSFNFFGKDLKVDYAREKSDRIAKRDGTFIPKDRRSKQKKVVGNSRREGVDMANSGEFGMEETTRGATDVDMSEIGGGGGLPAPSSTQFDSSGSGSGFPPASVVNGADDAHISSDSDPKSTVAPPSGAGASSTSDTPPSKFLFAQNLPVECTKMMIEMLFRQYSGFREVRIPRQGLAFIEFDDEPNATLALRGLNGFKLTSTETLDLKYGKN